jgi:hypothetical protein
MQSMESGCGMRNLHACGLMSLKTCQQSQLVHSPAYALKTEIVPHESWTIRVRTLIAREGDRDDRP